MGHRQRTPRWSFWRLIIVAALGISTLLVIVAVTGVDTTNALSPFITTAPVENAILPEPEAHECPAKTATQLPSDLSVLVRDIEVGCSLHSSVSWSEFHGDPETHQGKYVDLTDADFKYGTLRLRHPACLRLTEDVEVDFSANNDYRVNSSDPEYSALAYRTGFFAAITVETEHFVIDLGGHEMRQSRTMNIQQRPYAHISLTDRPFLFNEGPANFGEDEPVAGHRGAIFNGRLGLSSHHGIHGNDASQILIENLEVADYEVAGIALNGASDIVVRNVSLLGTNRAIPVRGFYNQARIVVPIIDASLRLGDKSHPLRAALVDARNALVRLINDVVEDIGQKGLPEIDASLHPEARALFHNDRGMMDGNSYGILFNARGFAVENFRNMPSALPHNVLIQNVTVANTVANVREVVALENVVSEEIVKGPVGDVVRIEDIADHDGNGAYRGDALSEAQFALAEWVEALDLDPAVRRRHFGTLSIGSNLIGWRRGTGETLYNLVHSGRFRYRRNGDTMFHVNKGVFGLRIDGGSDVCVRDVLIQNVTNLGVRAHMAPLAGEYKYRRPIYEGVCDTGGHPAQAPQQGYMGADVRGVSVAASSGVIFERVNVSEVRSEWGWAHGIDVFNGAQNCTLQWASVVDVSSLEGEALRDVSDTSLGTKMGRAAGICMTSDTAGITHQGLSVSNISSGVIGCTHDFLIDPVAVGCAFDGNRSNTYGAQEEV